MIAKTYLESYLVPMLVLLQMIMKTSKIETISLKWLKQPLIEASANKVQNMIWIKVAGSHKSAKEKFRSKFTNSSRLYYEQIWSLHSRHFAEFLIQDFDLNCTA